jgi:hypothetical protein
VTVNAAQPTRDAFHQGILARVIALAHSRGEPKATLLNVLRLAAKHRALLLQNTLLREYGPQVLSGPFQGMTFVRNVAEGCCVPKLLGCYEEELHPHVEDAISAGYEQIVNIGVAEGYYAVGLARRVPSARVDAFDIDENAQRTCAEVARLNGVGERLHVSGLFRGEDFAKYQGKRTLLVCDIEGAEKDLLDPERYPALRDMDLIVELHDCIHPKLSTTVPARFAKSHAITLVKQAGRAGPLPPLFDELGHLDQLLAVWEWRMGPTPWAIMKSRTLDSARDFTKR